MTGIYSIGANERHRMGTSLRDLDPDFYKVQCAVQLSTGFHTKKHLLNFQLCSMGKASSQS